MSTEVLERLGKYQVLREIGRGSMGTVYLGYDPYADRQVAIKVAHAEQLNDEEGGERYRKMFFNEAHTAGRLTHPNIIGIYDAGVDGEICYIVMELVRGETLRDWATRFIESHGPSLAPRTLAELPGTPARLRGVASLLRSVKGDVQIFGARKGG